jgi:hypothetical protein
MGLLSGSLILFPGCDLSPEKVSRILNDFEVTEKQDTLLKLLVDTLIPETEVPGAGSLGIQDFVWIMVDECLDKDRQTSYLKGLQGFNSNYREITGSDFDSSGPSERVAGLDAMIKGMERPGSKEHVLTFIEITKSFSILGYTQSKYYMTELMPYTLIPGKNPECRIVSANEKINVNA